MAGQGPQKTDARGNVKAPKASSAPAAATVKREPTPEEVAKALELGKANQQTPNWNGTSFDYIPIAGAPASNPVLGQTQAASGALQNDLARRQAAPNPFQVSPQPIVGSGAPGTPIGITGAQATAGNAARGGAPAPMQTPAVAPRAAGPATPLRSPGLATAVGGAPSATQTAATQAQTALGPAPQIDRGLADRGLGNVDAALGLSRQAVNAALAPVDQTGLQAATADARAVLDRLLNGPNTADRLGAQSLRSQLALARSAAGGPGAVQAALANAAQQAPELQAQAHQAATNEELAKVQAAGNVTGQLQTAATNAQANDTARLNAASAAASGFAQGALGSRGQDIDIAKSNQDAASNLLNNVAQLTGTQLELDQRGQELLGQMARDANATNFNWAQLNAQQQEAEFDRWVKVYGIDQAAAAQIKAASKANSKSVWDYVIPLVGAAATIGAGALAGPAGAAGAAAVTAAVS